MENDNKQKSDWDGYVEPGSKLLVLGMVIQPLIGNPYNGYINPNYWVDDHPLLYRNNGSLDPSTHQPVTLLSRETNCSLGKPRKKSCRIQQKNLPMFEPFEKGTPPNPQGEKRKVKLIFWLVVSTHLKNISQICSLPQIGVKIKNVWNHQPVFGSFSIPTLPETKPAS